MLNLYISPKTLNFLYPQLCPEQGNKANNKERTSILSYFLAHDMSCKTYNTEILDLNKNTPTRDSFINNVSHILSLDEYEDSSKKHQASNLGQIVVTETSIKERVGKNFLSTQIHRASKNKKVDTYPARPPESSMLEIGHFINENYFGVKKHPKWKQNFFTFLEFRKCKKNTFPLVCFLLRNYRFNFRDDTSLMEEIKKALYTKFTKEVADFLINYSQPLKDDNIIDFFDLENEWNQSNFDPDLYLQHTSDNEDISKNSNIGEDSTNQGMTYHNIEIASEVPRNKIIYGAPGTGKSYKLDLEVKRNFGHSADNTLRVTFHPTYTYAQFIGSYRPVPLYTETNVQVYDYDKQSTLDSKLLPTIDYRFVPGPFLEMLVKAYKFPKSSFVLIIEELNRASAASVFGDTFQLLDRDSAGNSQYSIRLSNEAMHYLRNNGLNLYDVRLPSNFFLWATMNSADQGVSPLDAAFKRRWSFEYLPLDENDYIIENFVITLPFMNDKKILWNEFRKLINNTIKDHVPEDRLIGPFFFKTYELQDPNAFKNKLLLYLREDVLRHNYTKLFRKKNFHEIVTDFDNGEEIFVIPIEEFERCVLKNE